MVKAAIESYHIPDSAKNFRYKSEFHRHSEGFLYPSQLFAIAEHPEVNVGFSEQSKVEIQRIFEQTFKAQENQPPTEKKKKSLENFIARLSTRWMRLIIAKIMVHASSSDESRRRIRFCLSLFVDTQLKQAFDREKLTFLNLLYSPFNMVIDGDLHHDRLDKLEKGSLINEERETYEALKNKDLHGEQYEDYGVSWIQYAQTVHKITTGFLEMKKNKGEFYTIIKTLSLRREIELFLSHYPTHEQLQQPSKLSLLQRQAYQVMNDLHRLFCDGAIDIVDICGNETLEKFKLVEMILFLLELVKRSITTSVHAGELDFLKKRKQGKENLSTALNLKNLLMIAHALRLLDKNNEKLLELAGKIEMIIAWNLRSNKETGLSAGPKYHTAVRNFNELVQHNTIDVLATDDPNAISLEDELYFLVIEVDTVIQEIVTKHKKLFDRETVETYFDQNHYVAAEKTKTRVREDRQKSQAILTQNDYFIPEFLVLPANVEGKRASV